MTFRIETTYSGYIRTTKDSGNANFREEYEVEANSREEALQIVERTLNMGVCAETFIDSDFNYNSENIVRNDTYKETNIELLNIDENTFKDFFYEKIEEDFPLIVIDMDGFYNYLTNVTNIDFLKSLYEDNNFYTSETIVSYYWGFLDNKYFFPNKIRLSIANLNLKGITPKTYFEKTKELNKKILFVYTELTFYENKKTNTIKETKLLLNDILETLFKENKLDFKLIEISDNLNKKNTTNELSNRKKKILEKQNNNKKKQKIENILKTQRKELILNLKKIFEEEKLDFDLNKINFILKVKD